MNINKNFFKIDLTLSGIGYKAECSNPTVENKILTLQLGYSHSISLKIPEDIQVTVGKEVKPAVGTGENQRISLVGPCFNSLSNYAQQIKRFRIPDTYKGKGVIIHNKKDLSAIKTFRKEGKQKN